MSKSYKYPVYKDKANKFIKRASSKKNRAWLKTLDFGFKSSKQFKYQVNQYDLCDWLILPNTKEQIKKARRK